MYMEIEVFASYSRVRSKDDLNERTGNIFMSSS